MHFFTPSLAEEMQSQHVLFVMDVGGIDLMTEQGKTKLALMQGAMTSLLAQIKSLEKYDVDTFSLHYFDQKYSLYDLPGRSTVDCARYAQCDGLYDQFGAYHVDSDQAMNQADTFVSDVLQRLVSNEISDVLNCIDNLLNLIEELSRAGRNVNAVIIVLSSGGNWSVAPQRFRDMKAKMLQSSRMVSLFGLALLASDQGKLVMNRISALGSWGHVLSIDEETDVQPLLKDYFQQPELINTIKSETVSITYINAAVEQKLKTFITIHPSSEWCVVGAVEQDNWKNVQIYKHSGDMV